LGSGRRRMRLDAASRGVAEGGCGWTQQRWWPCNPPSPRSPRGHSRIGAVRGAEARPGAVPGVGPTYPCSTRSGAPTQRRAQGPRRAQPEAA
jgi:hypothetical protein